MKIDKLQAYEILDSRGNPTVEVELTSGKIIASASVPSGVSTGANEAAELRDGDKSRYNGKGVLKAVFNVNKIIREKIIGNNISSQKKLDNFLIKLDGTENKASLGANAILAVSIAFAKAMAQKKKIKLYEHIACLAGCQPSQKFAIPTPMFNILNGGKHTNNNVDIQEFMVVPCENLDYLKKLQMGGEIFHALGKLLKQNNENTNVGDEGGYAPKFKSYSQIFEIIIKAGQEANYAIGKDFRIAIDSAASSFYNKEKNKYILNLENKIFNKKELIEIYKEWAQKYFLFSIEDGLNEEDFNGWTDMREALPKQQLVADDLTATNIKRIKKAIKNNCANAIIIKPNQIGTITEAIECVKKAKKAGWKIIAAHRSGETCDSFLADFAVGISADYIKAGAPSRGERLAKYNRLLKIESYLKI